jgi:hypothetical protein
MSTEPTPKPAAADPAAPLFACPCCSAPNLSIRDLLDHRCPKKGNQVLTRAEINRARGLSVTP